MRFYWLLLITLFLGACGSSTDDTEKSKEKEAPVEVQREYIELGDLEAIRQHNTLRLIAPRFDGADGLPRDGVAIQTYQDIASAFAEQLQLDVQWVFVDRFEDLLPTLNAGKGDIVVTNMTVTKARREQASFSKSLNQVNEVVVGLKSLDLDDEDDLQGLTVAVPAGNAYLETLQKLLVDEPDLFQLTVVDSALSEGDILDAIVSGEYQATVIDSDVARALLGKYPTLQQGAVLKRNRSIAWAVRKGNPQLRNELNKFLVEHHIVTATREASKRDWETIKNQGRLRMLTLNNPASYFMWRGELMGFDYDLMKKFASQHNLHLAVIMKDSIPELFEALKKGEGDVIAASLTQSEERAAQGLAFSDPYLKVVEQLVSMTSGPKVESVEALAGYRVGVNPNTVFYTQLKELQQQGIDVELVEYPNTTTEKLIQLLEQGEFDFTLADSHLLAVELAHDKPLHINLNFSEKSPISWILRPEQTALTAELNRFIDKQYRGLFYNVTFNKYFKNKRKIKKHSAHRVTSGQDLSPYDDIVKPLAEANNMDWRLIISQMYQESRFDTNAKSFAGAQGLMQVLPRTAREMGYSELTVPANGIGAGITYMNWLRDRFPGEMDFQERLYFTLAAYNAGTGHVRDARRLAKKLGKDPNRWFGHTEEAMLLLSEPRYFRLARFGYVRGSEPVEYVRRIRDRYLGYITATR
ncbi:hypothetical protein R50073_06330 [Maricurvus nonylphenolicus]|uniref:transporter substrate-binding domain-containing protein n=1 Tax=Maricurvus nonylphenolicus TaxID=1008307 RepID=UPI0036F30D08